MMMPALVLGQLKLSPITFGESGIGNLPPGGLAELGIESPPAAKTGSPRHCSDSGHTDPACRADMGRRANGRPHYGTPEDYYDGLDTGAATSGVNYNWAGGNIVNNTLEELLLCELPPTIPQQWSTTRQSAPSTSVANNLLALVLQPPHFPPTCIHTTGFAMSRRRAHVHTTLRPSLMVL